MTAPHTPAALRSDEKAAIVLFCLGPERAEKLFRQMNAAEHRQFAHAFNRPMRRPLPSLPDPVR
jgi:flagellar motor switch protein FliG